MSAYGSIELALEAIQAGAYDYISKPFKPDEVVLALRKAEERETLRRENRALKEQIRAESQFESILAKSAPMQEVFRTIAKIAYDDRNLYVFTRMFDGASCWASDLARLISAAFTAL